MRYYPNLQQFWDEFHPDIKFPIDLRWLSFPLAALFLYLFYKIFYFITGSKFAAIGVLGFMIYPLSQKIKPYLEDVSIGGLLYKDQGNVRWLLTESPDSFTELSDLDLDRAKKAAAKLGGAIKERRENLHALEGKGFKEDKRLEQLANCDKCESELNEIISEIKMTYSQRDKAREDERFAKLEQKEALKNKRVEIKDKISTLYIAFKSGMVDEEEYDRQMEQLEQLLDDD